MWKFIKIAWKFRHLRSRAFYDILTDLFFPGSFFFPTTRDEEQINCPLISEFQMAPQVKELPRLEIFIDSTKRRCT